MKTHDMFGFEITLSNKSAVDIWNKTIKGFLSHAGYTGTTLGETLELDNTFAIAHACKGLFCLILGRRELDATAIQSLASAKASDTQNPVTERERHYITALEAWLNGKPRTSIAEMEKVLKKWPADALAMKLSHGIRFMLGDLLGMRTSIENIIHVYGGHPAEGYVHGCYAFTLEEAGEYEKAERRGRKALRLAPDDAWGLHAISHVFDMTGRPQAGLEFISDKQQAWEHCNNFSYHMWWHIALMHLELGNYDKVLELYDEDIRQDKTDDYRDISNATSVLLRLEFEGVDVGNRWQELSELCGTRTEDNCVAFADLHYMMALIRGDDQTATTNLLSSMQSCGEVRHHCEMTAAITHPALTAAQGLEAFRDHDFKTAYKCLAKSRPFLQDIGGSHAQRDIFERLAIECALQGGLLNEAKTLLTERDSHRGHQDGYSMRRWDALEKTSNPRVLATA